MSSPSGVGREVFVGRGNPEHKRLIWSVQEWNTAGTPLMEL